MMDLEGRAKWAMARWGPGVLSAVHLEPLTQGWCTSEPGRRIMTINSLDTITPDAIEAAREVLVVGV